MQIVHDYRTLHTIPEPDDTLPKTIGYIKSQLRPLRCSVFSPIKGAVCAYFDFGKPQSIAFRADMDALPVQEQTDLPWLSRHPGMMHACGHDGHSAILLELARRLHGLKNLHHNVLLIFQPAEETDGGAQRICQAGILSQYKVCAICGLHLWPGLEKGQLFSRKGVLMSRSCGVTVTFFGPGGHIANTETGRDALSACCQFFCHADKLTFPFPHLLKFGKLTGGTAGNILCDRAVLEGSLRTYHESDHRLIQEKLHHLQRYISQKTGCPGDIRFTAGYPAVCNHPKLLDNIQKHCPIKKLYRAVWTADDFSFYQKQVPGVYFLLGVGDTPPLHSPRFTFDEAVLTTGADFFFQLCQSLQL